MRTVPAIANPCPALRPTGTRHLAALIAAAFAFFVRPRRRLLDVRELPDHLKRDIGALDGNDPRGPRG